MAQGATIYNFEVDLSHVDRGIYDTLSFKVARAPSETPEYLLTRVLAYCLEYTEGIAFGRGFAEPNEPALSVRDLTGKTTVWVEVGAPDAARLHRASLTVPRVVVYTHRDMRTVLGALEGERIHRGEALEIYSLDQDMLAALVTRLDRRTRFALSVSDDHLYITFDDLTLSGELGRHRPPGN